MRPGPARPHHRKIVILIIAVIVLVGFFVLRQNQKTSPDNSSSINPAAQPSMQQAAINGTLVESATAQQRPIAAVVENHPDARPQAGLSEADIVYETLAEGGITRYLALFQTHATANIGPIRSARVYFADIANDWHALFVHVGGNSDALTNIRNGTYKNISDADQFFNDPYFHRISSRPAPHNVYTSVDMLRRLMIEHSYSATNSSPSWQFKDDMPTATAPVSLITIPFSTSSYTVSYRYDASSNNYKRFVGGTADRDANNKEQLTAKNVIVQFADDFPTTTDTVGSLSFTLNGSGKARIFLDGREIQATWKRANDLTRYYDSSGTELQFNRGTLWIALVPRVLSSAVVAK